MPPQTMEYERSRAGFRPPAWSSLVAVAISLVSLLLVGSTVLAANGNWIDHDRLCINCGGNVGLTIFIFMPAAAFLIALGTLVITAHSRSGAFTYLFASIAVAFSILAGALGFLLLQVFQM